MSSVFVDVLVVATVVVTVCGAFDVMVGGVFGVFNVSVAVFALTTTESGKLLIISNDKRSLESAGSYDRRAVDSTDLLIRLVFICRLGPMN